MYLNPRYLILICVFFIISQVSFAQEIGLRFGDIIGNNVAVDAVFDGNKHRHHLDVSFGRGLGVEWVVNFIVKPLGGESLDYYIGAGAFALFGDPLAFGACGEIGLEYRFSGAPFVIGLDWRPAIPLHGGNNGFIGSRFGLNVRYVL